MTRTTWRLVVVAALILAPMTVTAAAHGHEDETNEGYQLVQQALAHLAHDTTSRGIDLAIEKVSDALETDDQEGVDVAGVRRGMQRLEAGRVGQARTLLQDSITAALADQPLATGFETGTGLVPAELPGRGSLGVGDGVLLVLSLAVAGVGVWLSVRFRPHDSVSALRLILGAGPKVGTWRDSPELRKVRHQR